MKKTLGILLVLLVVAGGAYWFTQKKSAAIDPRFIGPDGTSIEDNLTLGTDGSEALGTYLIGWTGMTVYTFDKDKVGTTTCYGQCAQKWPPYIVPAGLHINAQAGVDAGSVSAIPRAGGDMQLTYKGMPLYFYAEDTTGSDTKGDGLGGVWHVVTP